MQPMNNCRVNYGRERASGHVHDWKLSDKTTPSGKLLYVCRNCGIEDPAPVKSMYEYRPCKNKI